jgi:hypothetical protein
MQKSFTYKTFLLFTLLFVLIAIGSFAAFGGLEQAAEEAACCLKMKSPTQQGELFWELLSKKFLMFLSV